jgi:hypothetical protein
MEEFYILRQDERAAMINEIFKESSENINDLYLEVYKSLIRKEEDSLDLGEVFRLKISSFIESIELMSQAIQNEIVLQGGIYD